MQKSSQNSVERNFFYSDDDVSYENEKTIRVTYELARVFSTLGRFNIKKSFCQSLKELLCCILQTTTQAKEDHVDQTKVTSVFWRKTLSPKELVCWLVGGNRGLL